MDLGLELPLVAVAEAGVTRGSTMVAVVGAMLEFFKGLGFAGRGLQSLEELLGSSSMIEIRSVCNLCSGR